MYRNRLSKSGITGHSRGQGISPPRCRTMPSAKVTSKANDTFPGHARLVSAVFVVIIRPSR